MYSWLGLTYKWQYIIYMYRRHDNNLVGLYLVIAFMSGHRGFCCKDI
ncbi:MAG: hypothetical protein C5S44_02075 [Candidatus Methanocomedens sp.]|nr:MAG: hypothetical protein C5S44_02075 [ANME-2 cluster archaeon]